MPLSALCRDELLFRPATPEDIPTCYDIEIASYPADEAASRASLEYRQQHATPYFRCAVLDGDVIGFVCSTRCDDFTEESMSMHSVGGTLLAIHSVVVKEECRREGVATTMLKDYIEAIKDLNDGVEKIVLLAKSHLLGFYVNCGFSVVKPSDIVHGQDLWYDLEMDTRPLLQTLPKEDESWFVKTEQFCIPFPEVKPHLEAHRAWVAELRSKGICITSGYRVDGDGKPGGGGMMFFAAKSYQDAEDLVQQDPLVANECVEWRLNGWIAEVGNIQLR